MEFNWTELIDGSVSEALLNRQVARRNDPRLEVEPELGRVVAANRQQKLIWVLWPNSVGDPVKHYPRDLVLLKAEPMDLFKNLKWHGKSLGALEKFLEQARVEGADYDTELNPGTNEHVHIKVSLPLRTESDTVDLVADDKVIATRDARMD